VAHEGGLPTVRHAKKQYDNDRNVLGLVLRIIHFKGVYWFIDL